MDIESLRREVQNFSQWTKLYKIQEAAVLWTGQALDNLPVGQANQYD
jgi:hypothetical protein